MLILAYFLISLEKNLRFFWKRGLQKMAYISALSENGDFR